MRCQFAICTSRGCVAPAPNAGSPSKPPQPAPQTLAEHLKKRRLELHILQKDLANQFGVHEQSIGLWERGVGVPMIRHFLQIIAFLGYDPEPEPESLPKRIAYARRRLGFTQDDLAEALEVDTVSIWRWDSGQVEPPAARLGRLNELLKAKQIPIRL